MTSGVILRKDSEEVNVEKNKLDVIAIIPIRIFFLKADVILSTF